MSWDEIKENAQMWYGKVAQFFLFQNIVMYLFACASGHAAVGLVRYIEFLDHCCQWVTR
jgi:hypothetical protein